MTENSKIRQVFQRYAELVSQGDAVAIAALYTEDAWIEDPIGTPKVVGRPAIQDFYAKGVGSGGVQMELTGPVRACKTEGAAPLKIRVPAADREMDVIDVMTFDDEGGVTSMRAFWSPD